MDIKNFMFAGKARFTLENTSKGTHLTYRVSACKDKPGLFFVSVLTGSDNTNSYTYLGTIRDGVYEHGRKSTISASAPSAKAFTLFYTLVSKQYPFPPSLAYHHEGRCGRCGRVLTVPESLRSGIGPECARSGIA